MFRRFGPYPYAPFDGPVTPPGATNLGDFCIQVDKKWVPYLVALLYTLTAEQTWASDQDRVIGEAQNLILEVERQIACAVDLVDNTGIEVSEDCDMKLRYCNGILQVCDCGTWVDVPNCDGQDGFVPVVGSKQQGAPQAAPGACATYRVVWPARGPLLLPTTVSAGDTLEAFDFDGNTTEVGGIGRWNCQDGLIFFDGLCLPLTGVIDPAALAPTIESGKILYLIDSVYYDATALVTVPGGVSNSQVALICNYAAGGNYGGEITGQVSVCNNQAASFTHHFEVSLTPDGWSVRDEGTYVPGSGFHDGTVTYGTSIYRGADIQLLSIPAFTLTRVQWTADFTPGAAAPDVGLSWTTPGSYSYHPSPVSGTNIYDTGIINIPGVTQLYIDMICGHLTATDPGGSALISEILVSGQGADPF